MSNKQLSFRIENLGCASCAAKIENAAGGMPQVEEAIVDFAASKIYLKLKAANDGSNLISDLDRIVRSIEEDARLIADTGSAYEAKQAGGYLFNGSDISDSDSTSKHETEHDHYRSSAARAGGFSSSWQQAVPKKKALRFLLGIVIFVVALLTQTETTGLSIGLFIAAWLVLGLDVIYKAVRRLVKGQLFDENFLMTIATIGALAIREYPEAVAVMLFYQLGEIFQDIAVNRSRASIKALTSLRPDHANLLKPGSLHEYERIAPEAARPGDRLLIKAGERVPLDGRIIQGDSELDTSVLTGESLPQAVGPDSDILAGSVNGAGLLIMEVMKPYDQSSAARIMELVEQATARKSKAELFISRFAAWYTPAMTILAALIAFVPPLILGQPFSDWIYRAMILLVISCPCALVLSVPMSYFAGLGAASSAGVLIKGAQYLDRLSGIEQIVFDKTGTLTEGKFTVTEVIPAQGWKKEEILQAASMLEGHSDHPIAVSIRNAQVESGNKQTAGMINLDASQISEYKERPGFGVQAVISEDIFRLGNDRMIAEISAKPDGNMSASDSGQHVWLLKNHEVIGKICLADSARPEAAEAISGLRALGINKLSILTGDRPEAAASIAEQLGLDSYHASLLPQQKVEKLEELMNPNNQNEHVLTMFVGDGINDAPVLARADIGVAAGLATDAAAESSDMMIMGNDLRKLVSVVSLSRKTARIVRQNVALTLGLKIIVMSLAIFGLGGIWQAVFADVGVSLLAVLNALRLLRHRA